MCNRFHCHSENTYQSNTHTHKISSKTTWLQNKYQIRHLFDYFHQRQYSYALYRMTFRREDVNWNAKYQSDAWNDFLFGVSQHLLQHVQVLQWCNSQWLLLWVEKLDYCLYIILTLLIPAHDASTLNITSIIHQYLLILMILYNQWIFIIHSKTLLRILMN